MPATQSTVVFPPVLSATGAFRDVKTLTPADGLIPFNVNSPLWSDGAIKTRWMAIPDGTQIGFAPADEWTFPAGSVFVKHFELVVNEATGERRRMETRLLVRTTDGRYGVTYKWRADNSDADLLVDGLNEDIPIITTQGTTRIQRYTYPSRADCLFCHNRVANYVLGPHTHQLNGDFTYPATGRTDNQLRTLAHIGLLNPAPTESEIPTLLKAAHINDTTATVQHRMRSWIDSNCSDCHRPGGFGPGYDARFYTPLNKQNLINTYVKFRDIAGSLLYQRDNALDSTKMPPLAKNVVHEAAMANLRQWIASPLEVLSVYLTSDQSHLAVRFNSHVDPATARRENYGLDQGLSVLQAAPGNNPATIVLTTSALVQGQSYTLILNDVQDTATAANTIWPNTSFTFRADFPPVPVTHRLANLSSRLRLGTTDSVGITGFIIRGAETKRLVARALGPSLTSAGLTSLVTDPVLTLHDSAGAVIATNDAWQDNYNRQEISDTTVAPNAQNEPAILKRLSASSQGTAYTVDVRGADVGGGTALVELFDLDEGVGSELVNLSTRGFVGTADNVLIGGFIVAGSSPMKLLMRALGPSLPVAGALVDPIVELHDINGSVLQVNDDWKSTQQAEIAATGIPPTNDHESAILRSLLPGNYTLVVRDATNSSGIGLLEIYAIE